jgi:hypothetical protein
MRVTDRVETIGNRNDHGERVEPRPEHLERLDRQVVDGRPTVLAPRRLE